MVKWWIGCSGFHYKHWKEIFYPVGLAQRKWFSYYCEHFNTLELNVTFYRFPKLPFLEEWYQKSPEPFRFAVKAPRLITHYKKFTDSRQLLDDFYGTISAGLGDKLGCVLFQLPPNYKYSPEHLEKIITNMDSTFENVLEFRNASWWNPEVYDQLAKNKITFCSMSHPGLPDTMPGNTKMLYHRFHGVPELYKSPYSEDELKIFTTIINKDNKIKTAYIYFNNDIGGSAILNAKMLQAMTVKPLKTRAPVN